eukprot:TRINITY_DN1685_c2_g2_i1.p1 TRINITY_DN1685_c2_g2~~TRINITY_DN1685_c2_g2_i1.p1  ORF type:complete len:976 (-),score=325.29 TRINITY_DN1685_c2_g2_i1:639-3518(-)
MSRFNQHSKFRHVVGKPVKAELCYPDLPAASNSDGKSLAVSTRHLVVAAKSGNGGTLNALSLSETGKRRGQPAQIQAHSSQIYDLQFSPFDDDLLFTGADDGKVCLWRLPSEGVTSNISSAEANFVSHKRRITSIRCHPSANNIIATSSSDKTVRVWDVESSSSKFTIQGHGDQVSDLSWNLDGSLLASACKDKNLRTIDPRQSSIAQTVPGHDGVMGASIVWLRNLNLWATTGFSKFRERQIAIWDPRNLDKAQTTTGIDNSTGSLIPLFDQDTNVLMVAGRGDNTIRVYDVTAAKPFLTELSKVNSQGGPQRDVVALPKRALNVMDIEVMRLFRLADDQVTPVSFTVPRKNKYQFQADLFPDSQSHVPSLEAQAWLAGDNANPILSPLDPEVSGSVTSVAATSTSSSSSSNGSSGFCAAANVQRSSTRKPAVATAAATEDYGYGSTSADAGDKPATTSSSSIELRPSRRQVLEEEERIKNFVPEYTPKAVKVVRSSHFRHIKGSHTKKELFTSNLRFDPSLADFQTIDANDKYFAVPWVGPGGKIAVVPLNVTGRLPDTGLGLVETGSKIADFKFSPFDKDVIAAANEDSHIRLFRIPENLHERVSQNHTEPIADLTGHRRRLISINWHPCAAVLGSTSHDGTIRLWDIESGKEGCAFRGLDDSQLVQAFAFSRDGSRIATTTRDKLVSVFDPRSGSKVDAQWEGHHGVKGMRLTWMGDNDRVITTGFSKSSDREFAIWDVRNTSAPTKRMKMDVAAGILEPVYDRYNGILYCLGKGDISVSYFEIKDEAPHAHFINKYQDNHVLSDGVFLPKQSCNVAKPELMRMLKLTPKGAIIPITFTVPRTRTEFFQDDLFPPVDDTATTSISPSSFFAGQNAAPNSLNLCPAGMTNLSDAPVIVREKKYSFNPLAPVEKEVDLKEAVMSRFFTQMQEHKETDDQNFQTIETTDGCSDSEWSD